VDTDKLNCEFVHSISFPGSDSANDSTLPRCLWYTRGRRSGTDGVTYPDGQIEPCHLLNRVTVVFSFICCEVLLRNKLLGKS
jgi:hypothetical protein